MKINKYLIPIAVCAAMCGCIEEPAGLVSFDQTLESTTMVNRLLAPVIVSRIDMIAGTTTVLDTIPPHTTRTYQLGKKGLFRHTWTLIPPRDQSNVPVGVVPTEDFGVQYQINKSYDIDNEIEGGREIFTPFVVNPNFFDMRLTANDRVQDQLQTNYIIGKRSSIEGAPYFYWNSNSNVRVDGVGNSAYYIFTRGGQDTNIFRGLELDTADALKGSGSTFSIVAQ